MTTPETNKRNFNSADNFLLGKLSPFLVGSVSCQVRESAVGILIAPPPPPSPPPREVLPECEGNTGIESSWESHSLFTSGIFSDGSESIGTFGKYIDLR